MTEIKTLHIEDVAPYSGPGTFEGIQFRALRDALGISAFGINALEIAPNCTNHPEHSHKSDGHEEAYVVLRGSVFVVVDGEETRLDAGGIAFVPGESTRKLVTKEDGALVLALGGTPGAPYTPSMGG